jgi:uncharacterized membrane protein YqjE
MAIEAQGRREVNREAMSDQLRRGMDEIKELRAEFSGFFDDVRGLAEKEMQLARAEMSEQVAYAKNGAMSAAVAAVVALLTLAFLATTLMFALDQAMETWLAALITSGVLLGLTALAGMYAMSQLKRITVAPKKTIASVNEDVRWARDRMNFSEK